MIWGCIAPSNNGRAASAITVGGVGGGVVGGVVGGVAGTWANTRQLGPGNVDKSISAGTNIVSSFFGVLFIYWRWKNSGPGCSGCIFLVMILLSDDIFAKFLSIFADLWCKLFK